MVMLFAVHEAVTPEGNPVAAPIPVAPVVEWVIAVSAVLMQRVGVEEGAETVLLGVTVMVPVAFTAGVVQPPERGME